MAGSDILVFSAGAGGKGGVEMIDAIDGRGLELAVAAARQAGIQRFLLVSAFPEASRGKEVSETFEHYMAVKKLERKSVVKGKRVSVRVDLGGRRIIKKKNNNKKNHRYT